MAGDSDLFEYHSSPIDWCEDNYSYHYQVIEFWNTLSNVPFFYVSIAMLILFRGIVLYSLSFSSFHDLQKDYARKIDSHMFFVPVLLMSVGLGIFSIPFFLISLRNFL